MTEAERPAGSLVFWARGRRACLPRGLGVEQHLWLHPLKPSLSPLCSDTQQEVVMGLVWEASGGEAVRVAGHLRPWERAWQCVCLCALTVPSPQCCRGQRHHPVHAPPRGADQEWGQEVGEEFLPEKGASLSAQTRPLPPQRPPPGGPRDSAPLGSDPSLSASAQKCPAPSSPPPSIGDGEPAVRRADQDQERTEQLPGCRPLEPGRAPG